MESTADMKVMAMHKDANHGRKDMLYLLVGLGWSMYANYCSMDT